MSYTETPHVSVIIPVHNAGEYLNRLISSLRSQTKRELEFIFLLDCPTDGSDALVDQFADEDNRVVVIRNQENLHIGNSRNVGLQHARGEYCAFCDHDDYISPDMYEVLYMEAIRSEADIVCSGYGSIDGEKSEEYHYPDFKDLDVRAQMLALAFGKSLVGDTSWRFFLFNGGIWNKLFRHTLLVNNEISFLDTKRATYEDLFFLISALLYAKTVVVKNNTYYFHVESGVNYSLNYNYSAYKPMSLFIRSVCDLTLRNSWNITYREWIECLIVNSVYVSVMNEIKHKSLKGLYYCLNTFRHMPEVVNAFQANNWTVLTNPPSNTLSKIIRYLLFAYFKCI